MSTVADERTWLRHKDTGHFFHCPAEAVPEFAELGWEPTDERPAEPNPMVAERIAWEAEQAAQRAAAEQAAKAESKSSRRGKPAETEE